MSRLRPRFALAAALLAGVFLHAQGTPPASPLVLLTREGRRPVPTVLQNGQEYIALDDVAGLFQVTVREDKLTGGVTIGYNGRTVVVSPDQPMASVNGKLVSLPAAPVRSGRRWLVPVEFLSRALAPIYHTRIDLRKPSRLLILGDLRVPRVTARIDAGPPTRVQIDVSPASEVSTAHDAGRVAVRVGGDALDVALPVAGAGLVDQIRQGDQPTSLWVVLKNGGAVNASTAVSDGGTRVTIEIQPPAAPTAPQTQAPTPQPSPAEGIPSLAPRPALQTIAIDPGHGGDDNGATGAGGIAEKTITLDVAGRLKTLIESRLGIRVLLTRDDDRRVEIDERASVANNNKADLFISLHVNAAFVPSVSGAEVSYLALDEATAAAARASQSESAPMPVLGGATRSIDVVRWDMAQAWHVERSAVLAGFLEEELRTRVPLGPQPLKQAPLRVLVGANMPAAFIEMGYLTNAAQAQRLGSGEFQSAVAQAIYEAILRFRAHLEAQS